MQGHQPKDPWPPWWPQLWEFVGILNKRIEKEYEENGKEDC